MHGIFLSSMVSHREKSVIRPLGPYRLASHLRSHGYEIQVIDFIHEMTEEQLRTLLNKFITPETKFIGLGYMIDYRHPKLRLSYLNLARLLLLIKRQYPKIKFLMGGSTGFAWSRHFRNKEVFDYIVKGYGEDQTLALFDHYYKGTPHPPFEVVDGNKHLSEHLVVNKLFDFNHSAHTWDRRDCIQPGEALPIEFARGCIFKCSFCKYPHIGKDKNDYTKHVDCIREELISNYNNFGTTTYYVTDDTMNADVEFVKAFTDMSKSLPFKLQYGAFLRLDLIHAHQETADMFAENGLVSVYFGLESFEKENAKMLGKAWSAKHGKTYLPEIYHNVWKQNIHITAGMIAGCPGETLEDLRNVNQWFLDNQLPTWIWHPLYIGRDANYYKSEFDLNAEKYGFEFKVVEGKSTWYNRVCDENLAVDWVNELQNTTRPHMVPPTWVLLEFYTYGFQFEKSTKMKFPECNWKYITQRGREILENYYKDLLAL